MKQETFEESLEMAASMCAVKTLGRHEGKKNAAEHARTTYNLKKCFKAGAAWQRNSVWHNVSEKTDMSKEIIVIYPNKSCRIFRPNVVWEILIEVDKFISWAYIDDLLPTSFDEILKDNKDVLERLKKGETK